MFKDNCSDGGSILNFVDVTLTGTLSKTALIFIQESESGLHITSNESSVKWFPYIL